MKQFLATATLIIIAGTFGSVQARSLQPADSLATVIIKEIPDSTTTNLKEVTVEAADGIMKGNTITYYPSPSARKNALDAVNLLQRMQMSTVTIDPITKDISTPDGNPVSLFINFLPASEADINGLRGKDVQQVDVMDYPTDPRFRGEQHVVNIILRKQEFGGYTKIMDSQDFIVSDDNSGSIFSRLNNKKMTYDIYLGSTYSHSTHGGSNNVTTYRLKEMTVEKHEDVLNSKSKIWNIPVTFRAIYNTDKAQISNTIGYGFNRIYNQDETGRLYFIPQASDNNYSYLNHHSAHSNSLSYSGNFFLFLPREWSLSIYPYIAYTHSNSTRRYATDVPQFDPVVTDGKDDAIYSWLYLSSNKSFRNKHSLQLTLGVSDMYNNVKYTGTNNADDNLNRLEGYLGVTYQITLGNKLNAGTSLASGISRTRSNSHSATYFSPTWSVWASSNLNAKNRVSLSATVNRQDMSYSSVSDLLLRVNEFEYRQGNPRLKPFPNFNISASYTYLPMNALNLTAYARLRMASNMYTTTYKRDDQLDAIVISSGNTGKYHALSTGINITGKLFSSRLILTARPEFKHSNVNNFYRIIDNRFDFSLTGQYNAGDFSFSAYYQLPTWTVNAFAGIKDYNRSYYYLEGTWSRREWIISLKLKNFCRYIYHGQTTRISTEDYSTVSDINIPAYHANISLQATYTFGYGKKINRGNEIGAQGGAGTVMK